MIYAQYIYAYVYHVQVHINDAASVYMPLLSVNNQREPEPLDSTGAAFGLHDMLGQAVLDRIERQADEH